MTGEPRNFHFLGICGTAMGAVAAALRERGFTVTGSDENIYPPMSTFLEKQGVKLNSGYRAENIPEEAEVIVIGNAMTRGNPEVEAVLNRKLYYASLPEVLRQYFLRGRHNLVVTGTHGKTTTTSLLTWIMSEAGFDPSYMIGGIPRNLGQGARFNDSKHFVIEGDEYDTAFFDKRSKFIHYLPELLIVNNIEFDHADIFENLEQIKRSFRHLHPARAAEWDGAVQWRRSELRGRGDRISAPLVAIGFSENCAEKIREVSYSASGSKFSLGEESFEVPLIGEFNVRNAAMAITAARFYGAPLEKVRAALLSFEGIARRQEVRGEVGGVTVIDDFGHHPTAIAQTLTALRHRYPGPSLVGGFRAAFEHDAARCLAATAGGSAQRGRRGVPFGDRAPGADSRGRAARSRSGHRGDRGRRAAGVLREGRGAHCRAPRPVIAEGRCRGRLQ